MRNLFTIDLKNYDKNGEKKETALVREVLEGGFLK